MFSRGGGREFPWVTNFLGLEILNLALGKLFREGKFVRGGGEGGEQISRDKHQYIAKISNDCFAVMLTQIRRCICETRELRELG